METIAMISLISQTTRETQPMLLQHVRYFTCINQYTINIPCLVVYFTYITRLAVPPIATLATPIGGNGDNSNDIIDITDDSGDTANVTSGIPPITNPDTTNTLEMETGNAVESDVELLQMIQQKQIPGEPETDITTQPLRVDNLNPSLAGKNNKIHNQYTINFT